MLVMISCTLWAVVSAASFDDAWMAYKAALKTTPIITKSITSAIIMILSDTITQRVEMTLTGRTTAPVAPNLKISLLFYKGEGAPKTFEHDWVRTLHTAITGLAYSGPVAHFWYQNLEKIVTVKHRLLGLLLRSLLDAIIFSPFTIAGYFTVRTILEGTGIESLKEKLRTKWLRALFGAWQFWPMINLFMFALVPLQFRVLYSNIMSLLWTGYLTFMNQSRANHTTTTEKEEDETKKIPREGASLDGPSTKTHGVDENRRFSNGSRKRNSMVSDGLRSSFCDDLIFER